MTELDQALLVQPQPGDVAGAGGLQLRLAVQGERLRVAGAGLAAPLDGDCLSD